MINFLKSWTNQIIVTVIIATILEMILPNGNNKKYIKMVIGIYILFSIIQPIITKITGSSIDISKFNYDKYFNEGIIETSTKDFDENNSKLIKQAYIDNIKSDIKTKIKQKGYEIISLDIEIIEDENKNTYGTIQSINLNVENIKEDKDKIKEKSTNTINIENVNISINNNTNINESNNVKEKIKISEKEKKYIIEYLANEYSIDKKNIIIN